MNEKDYESSKFEDGDFSLDVYFLKDEGSVWLTQEQISLLFERSRSTITEHINNIIKENKISTISSVGKTDINGNGRKVQIYNLDVILEIGRRSKSNRTEKFYNWAVNKSIDLNNKKTEIEPIIRFEYDNVCLDVTVAPEKDTVWLTQAQICELFDTT